MSKKGTRWADSRDLVISAYRYMWIMVMFDLPVATKEQRHAAGRFRIGLLRLGFSRCQYSVYLHPAERRERTDTLLQRVKGMLPAGGEVCCLTITDKQFGSFIRFHGGRPVAPPERPEQFLLF